MLILSRKLNESIIIGDDVEILISEIKGDQVKIGINAPKAVRVHRGEVYAAIQKQNLAASQSDIPGDIDIFFENQEGQLPE